jgi:hypothetical protein
MTNLVSARSHDSNTDDQTIGWLVQRFKVAHFPQRLGFEFTIHGGIQSTYIGILGQPFLQLLVLLKIYLSSVMWKGYGQQPRVFSLQPDLLGDKGYAL